MSTMVFGKIICKKSPNVYLDPDGDNKWDVGVFCDRDTFVKIPRFCERAFSYYDDYAVMQPGDTVAFPVNIAPESIQKGYIIKPSELAGEPIVNGDNAFTLRLYVQMQEYKALIAKDKNFSLLSRVQ